MLAECFRNTSALKLIKLIRTETLVLAWVFKEVKGVIYIL